MMNSELTLYFWAKKGFLRLRSKLSEPFASDNDEDNGEQKKKRKYNQRILDGENGSFTPLIFTTNGGMST